MGDISMNGSKFLFTLGLAVAYGAILVSLTVHVQAQDVTFLAQASATSLIQATDGNLYGTGGGGLHQRGQVFRMTPDGKLTTIYSFCSQPNCADGADPFSAPVLGSDGNLYGVIAAGGHNDSGAFYRVTLDGQFTKLYTFCSSPGCRDGVFPTGIIQASDGNFYGTTEVGGKFNDGTIFQISPTGQFKLLYTFCSQLHCTDGEHPNFPPIQGIDGNFYGATYGGGSHEGGGVYELTPSGIFTVLHSFSHGYGENGTGPETIVQDANGNIFGTTVFGGGKHDYGTVFEITSSHQFSVLYKFLRTDAVNPNMGLILASDGNLYGMTQGGGANQQGAIFQITPAGAYTSLYSFAYPQGFDPFAGPLFQATNGTFYGTTIYGPNPNLCTIFSFTNGLGPLVETAPLAGKVGTSVIVLGNGLTGSTSVTFNGVAAAFTVQSDTYIKATVPAGATTGTVSVVTPSGTLNSNPQFVVVK
jgi:uncharacterized repeat protein (TIGR03803 family)